MSQRNGREGKAREMQSSRVEDEAEEMQRNQEEAKAQVMQRCTQVIEDVGQRRRQRRRRREAAKRRSPRGCSEETWKRPGRGRALAARSSRRH